MTDEIICSICLGTNEQENPETGEYEECPHCDAGGWQKLTPVRANMGRVAMDAAIDAIEKNEG